MRNLLYFVPFILVYSCSKVSIGEEIPDICAVISDFQIENDSCVLPCEIVLSNLSKNSSTIEWDLGDGNIISNQNQIRHTYTEAGMYPLQLAAFDNNCNSVKEHLVTVFECPTSLRWSIINSPTNEDLYAVHFPNDSVGYAAGARGAIIKSTNQGEDWKLMNRGILNTSFIYSIFFTNELTGFAIGNFGSAYKTESGGEFWFPICIHENAKGSNLRDIFFINEDRGFIIGDKTLYRTTNGDKWEDVFELLPEDITSTDLISPEIRFIDDKIGFILLQGRILKTTDGGNDWNSITLDRALATYDIDFLDKDTGYICGIGTGLYKTTDGGNEWNKVLNFPSTTLFSPTTVKFKNKSIGFVGGSRGEIYYTENDGNLWIKGNSSTDQDLHNIVQLDRTPNLIAVGKNGIILKK